ncbi:Metallo-dependent phosphatase-like protein [Dunaliella salina]|uniref:Manganese-dependent ADP-ribose/CDP-alcohol diphosphatase n=1 Tax=Dunaliella salina TaxID=3046 RepID=A0ABQ7GXB3_DUNSA|nr:Metallo-dependent phosphatase-like protein [Dunaliella salina]|eukprot:KAF5839236.1 Metallo-dependent phosphatase-like protein [Dunaliella salina]
MNLAGARVLGSNSSVKRSKILQHHLCDRIAMPSFRHRAQALSESEKSQIKPDFSFGIVADIQYADIPDGHSYHGTPRFYRNAKAALRRAVSMLREGSIPLSFTIQLGDIVDGNCKENAEKALDGILGELNAFGKPVYHMLGNHCLYNLDRELLHQKMEIPNLPADGGSYYSFEPHPSWRFVVLDSYDVSLPGWEPSHPRYQLALEWLKKNNPNENKNNPQGLEGVERRWVAFGGGASPEQVAWFKQQLQEASAKKQRVMVFSHLPFQPGTAPNPCLQWNYEELLDVMRGSSCVVATFAGHAHQNGYVRDEWGIHHLVLPSVLETPPGRDCYGHIKVYGDKVKLVGTDCMMSLDMSLGRKVLQEAA